MEDNVRDEQWKELLDNYEPQGLTPDWEAFSNYLQIHEKMTAIEEDALMDENVRDSVNKFEAPASTTEWQRVETSLNNDEQFDEHLRNKVRTFEAPRSKNSWPLLLQKISGTAYLRAKLITFKVIEVSAVLLLLFTVMKLGQMGKLPFETPLFDKQKQTTDAPRTNVEMAEAINSQNSTAPTVTNQEYVDDQKESIRTEQENPTNDPNHANRMAGSTTASSALKAENSIRENRQQMASAVDPIDFSINNVIASTEAQSVTDAVAKIKASDETYASEVLDSEASKFFGNHDVATADFVSSYVSPVDPNYSVSIPKPKFIKSTSRKHAEFGIISQVDFNMLQMPEDRLTSTRLYSVGQLVVFPEKGISNAGLGGGFTFAIAHPRWAFESGVIYSAKSFRPEREVELGDARDNVSVEFDAMRLQLLSIPLQVRYRVDHKGPFKVYGLTGFGLHLIAQSDIDVVIEQNFPSLSFGQNPNYVPDIAETIREQRRISEHFRDGAPFNSKSYFTLNTGAGIEYSLIDNKILFFQTSIQYQVPNLKFSNNDGKHMRSLSMQAGVRAPLGL